MESRHIVVLRRGQFCTRLRFSRVLTQRLIRTPCRRKRRDWDSCWSDWFDVLDAENRPVLTEREILRNLQAIVTDADQMPIHEVCELASFVSHLTYVPRSHATRLVFSQRRTARFGRACARR